MSLPHQTLHETTARGKGFFRALLLGSAIPLGLWLLFSGATKLFNPASFLRAVLDYGLLPDALAWLTAMLLPFIEIVCGLCLITGRARPSAAFITGLLGLVFVIAQIQAQVRGLDIACGCFELLGRESIGPRSIARAAILSIWAFTVLLATRSDPRRTPHTPSPTHLAATAVPTPAQQG